MAVNQKGLRIRMTQGIFLVLLAFSGVRGGTLKGCEQARKDVEVVGLPVAWVQDAPGGGDVCGSASCCSLQSETEMLAKSRQQLTAFLRDSISRLSSLIEHRAKKFDTLFREMMNTSKLEFHDMFQRTYGKIYLDNAEVFSDFFKELESYYRKGSTRLSETLESFFVILYKRMFTVINADFAFPENYLECVAEHMGDVKPFGDAPQKFALQLKRSFIATRTFYKALTMLAEVAKRMAGVAIHRDCDREMVQMRWCGGCRGLRGAGTCSGYCAAALQKCLRNHLEFGKEWDDFLGAVDKVAERLVGPYNIEFVVEPLHIKISEAIMNFQESGTDVTRKIFSQCGEPGRKTDRKRRETSEDQMDVDSDLEVRYKPMKKIGHKNKKKNKKHEEEEEGPSLELLVRDIRQKIRDTHQFWSNLPYQFCNNLTTSTGKCWNGTAIGDYTAPEIPRGNSSLVKEQIFVLQQFTEQLRNAYHGDEVQFADDSEDAFAGSGSGSGDFELEEETPPETGGEVEISRNDLEIVEETPKAPETPKSSDAPQMGLNRALAQFLIPIVLVWFGGAISDLL